MTTIYHIPGVKIGSTFRDPAIRVAEQGYSDFEVLEVHQDEEYAAMREIELQEQYGYKVDKTNRIHTVHIAGKKARSPEARRKAGAKKSKQMLGNKLALGNKGKLGKYHGTVYIEITTGFTGTHTQMLYRFNTPDVPHYAKQDRVITKGLLKGLHFRILEP